MEIRSITGARELNVLLNESYRNNTRIKLTDQDHVAIYTAPSNPMSRLVSWCRQTLGITRREQDAVARRLQELVDQSPGPAEPAGITRRVRAVSTPGAAAGPSTPPVPENPHAIDSEGLRHERIYVEIDDRPVHATAQETIAAPTPTPAPIREAIYATVHKGKVVESDEPPPLPPRNYLNAESAEKSKPAIPDADKETMAAIARDEARIIRSFFQKQFTLPKVISSAVQVDKAPQTLQLASAILDYISQSTKPLTEELRDDRTRVLKNISQIFSALEATMARQKANFSPDEIADLENAKRKLEKLSFINITARTSNPVKHESATDPLSQVEIQKQIQQFVLLRDELEKFSVEEMAEGLPNVGGHLLRQGYLELVAARYLLQSLQPQSDAIQPLNEVIDSIKFVNTQE